MFKALLFSLSLLISFNLRCQLASHLKDSFDHVFRDRWEYYVVVKNGLFGVVDTNYQLIIKPEYDFISPSWSGVFRVKKNNKWGIIDTSGKLVIPLNYDNIGPTGSHLFCAKKNGKWGLLDTLNRWIIPAEMDNNFNMYREAVVKKNGRYGVMSYTGQVIIPIKYKKCRNIKDPFSYVFSNGIFSKVYHKLDDDRILLDFKNYKNNLSLKYVKSFQVDNLYGLKNSNDSVILKPQFIRMLPFSEGLAYAMGDSFNGYIDTNGRQVIRLGRPYLGQSFKHGSANIYTYTGKKINGFEQYVSGSIDRNGKIIIPVIYRSLFKNPNGKYLAYTDSSIVFIDSNGNKTLEHKVDSFNHYEKYRRQVDEDMIAVEDEHYFLSYDKMGFINKQGNEITGLKYDLIYRFDNKTDVLIVKDKNLYGLITTLGKEILPLIYDNIEFQKLQSSHLKLKQNGSYGLFNVADSLVINCEYENIRGESEGLMASSKNGKWGFINSKGEVIIPFIYDSVTNFYENESKVVKGEKKFKINRLNGVIP